MPKPATIWEPPCPTFPADCLTRWINTKPRFGSAPIFAEAYYNLDIALSKSGRAAEAIPQFEAALRIQPDYADAHNNLGVALSGAGRVLEAIAHFEAALQINPNNADALQFGRRVIECPRQEAGSNCATGSSSAAPSRSGAAAGAESNARDPLTHFCSGCSVGCSFGFFVGRRRCNVCHWPSLSIIRIFRLISDNVRVRSLRAAMRCSMAWFAFV